MVRKVIFMGFPGLEAPQVRLPNNKSILVVDDHSYMRGLLKKTLRQIGSFDVYDAEDGVKALEVMRRIKINLVLSDDVMPKMGGLELLRTVRADEELCRTPFIMVSADSNPDFFKEAIEAKVNDILVKPFSYDSLREKLVSIFARRKKQ